MQSLDLIRKRIRSIEATKKITNAMKLVATTKIRKQRKIFEAASRFCVEYYKIFQQLVFQTKDLSFLRVKPNTSDCTLYVLISSDLGLCGAYNANVCKFLTSMLKPQDKIIVFGLKGFNWLKAHRYGNQVIRNLHWDIMDKTYFSLLPLGVEILNAFAFGKYSAIKIIYTQLNSSVKYTPQVWDVLPLKPIKIDKTEQKLIGNTIFEPEGKEIIIRTIPSFISNLIFGSLVESKVAESYSRRFAMEGATKNASELIEELKVQYNQARQEAITQEINEIISGAAGKLQ